MDRKKATEYMEALRNFKHHIGIHWAENIAEFLENCIKENEEVWARCIEFERACDNYRAAIMGYSDAPCRVVVILKNGERIAIDLEKATVNSDKNTGKITGYEFQGIKGAYPLYIDVADISAVVAEQRPVLGGGEAASEEVESNDQAD